MARYRLYFYDGGGQIADVLDLPVENDEAALELAETLRRGAVMELWDRTRLIKAYMAEDEAAKLRAQGAGAPAR